jgi:hypothetical protein
MLSGVDAGCGGVRAGHATGVRVLTGFGRNSLLSSLFDSANVFVFEASLGEGGALWFGGCPR